PGAEQHTQVGAPAVFDRGRKAERFTGARASTDVRIAVAGQHHAVHAGAVIAPPGEVECQHPASAQAVFPGRIDEERVAGPGVAAKAVRRAVDADILDVRIAGTDCATFR